MRSILCILVLFSCISCGVESTTTPADTGDQGTQKILISGTIQSVDGTGLDRLEVILFENGVSVTAGKGGEFSFSEMKLLPTLTFIVQGEDFSAQSSPLSVSENSNSIKVTLTLSSDKSSVSAVHEEDTNPEPSEGGTDQGSEVPTPSGSPTPSPTRSGDFNASGDTTSFGIPSGITGNRIRGKGKYFQQCGVCHSSLEGTHDNFGPLKRIIGAPPMNITMRDSALADIVAYLRYSGGAR